MKSTMTAVAEPVREEGCPFGCESAPCDLCVQSVPDPSSGDLRLGVAVAVAYLVIWLVSVIGQVFTP